MDPFVATVKKQFLLHANAENADGAGTYMRNQFAFLGIKAPVRQMISKPFLKERLPDSGSLEIIVRECWNLPQREFQYFAVDLIAAMKKYWTIEMTGLIEFMIIHKSWWDSVDHIASDVTGPFFLLFPQQVKKMTGSWNRSDNIWLIRSSIMFQKKYKKKTDTELLAKYILTHNDSKEFFIQKAIGWALREYSKTDPDWVIRFVKANDLAPLSVREALKRCG